jgi:DHA2 family multidrug resistance protein
MASVRAAPALALAANCNHAAADKSGRAAGVADNGDGYGEVACRPNARVGGAMVSASVEARRGPITLGLMMATIMSVLDTTVVNVSLPHIQGNLSASPEQITWVVTSYIVATAVMTPVSGWLAARVGLKPMLLLSIFGFTIASMLCGMAANLPEMVLFRMLQGMAGAPISPLCQAVLFNINPPERYGRAMAIYMMGGTAAPVIGPIVGAWLTESLSWRWCFYINLPAGIGATLLLWFFLPNERSEARKFDFLGFGSLAVAIAALQLMLDRGPSQDWFGSREIWIEAITALISFWVFLTHTLTARHPLFDAALARDRNFVSATLFGFLLNMLLFAGMTLLPLMTQGVLGYPVMLSGLMNVPRGLVMLLTLAIVGRLDAIIDRRLLVAAGLAVCLLGFWQMTQFDLSMTSRSIVWANALQGLGQGLIFVPISTLAFATVKPALRPDASAVSNLIRNVAGSVGIAMMQALTVFNGQAMHADLAAHVTAADPVLHAALPGGLDSVPGLMALNAEITRQADMVAYVDDYRLMVFLGLVSAPFLLLLRKPRRSAGEPAEAAPIGEI